MRSALSVLALGLAAGCANSDSRATRADGKAQSVATSSAQAGLPAGAAQTPGVASVGKVQTVATFDGAMPTGVAVSRSGRIFVNFPRWGDTVPFTVAEVKGGKPIAYPDAEINRYDVAKVAQHLVSVQSVVVDPADRLWLLDTGSVELGPVADGGAKLIGVDLKADKIVKVIAFPPDVALKTTYLNDVRFDLRRGKGGFAYITDSGGQGPNGIIVVDLDAGRSWRKLSGHRTVRAEEKFVPTVEGEKLTQRPVPGTSLPISMGADGIAISPDGARLFWTPLASRHLFSVSTDALADPAMDEARVEQTIVDHGDRGYASDGLESDANGSLYLADYEHNAIHRRRIAGATLGADEVIAQGPALIWPDTMSVAADGYLYFTANQLNRQKNYQEGKDKRQKPYLLLRTKIDGTPIALR